MSKENINVGLEKIIIIYDDKKDTYSVMSQFPNGNFITYYTIISGLKTSQEAKNVKDAYFKGFYDGKEAKEKELLKEVLEG